MTMHVTKYPQSCLVIEADNGARLLVDAGFHVVGKRQLDELGSIDAALYTHQHPDHFDPSWVHALADRGVPIFTNADTAALVEDLDIAEVAGGQDFAAAEVPVTAYDLPHMEMVDGRPGPPNLGFLIDRRLLHPGDAKDLSGLSAAVLATPIAGPSLSNRDAFRMVEDTGARVSIPVHFDHFLADPHLFAKQCSIADVVILDDGDSTEI
jgi:L-ascorbate metabolism protein UlaG (beta-lactamase superfamily)